MSEDKIGKYLDAWKGRFYLFDPSHPFFQSCGFTAKKPTTIHKIFLEATAGNNATIFDHRTDEDPSPVSPAEAARALTTIQSFGVGGGRSPTINFEDGTLIRKAVVLLKGESLSESLLLNLLPYDPNMPYRNLESQEPAGASEDIPAWESDVVTDGRKRTPNGYLDYLTWQCRTIRLLPDPDNVKTVVRWIYYAQGFGMEGRYREPMAGYRVVKEKGELPIRLSEGQAVWRSTPAFLRMTGGTTIPPKTIAGITDLISLGVVSRSRRYSLDVMGLCTDQAKISQWQHSSIPLPMKYLEDRSLVESVSKSVELSEKHYRALRDSLYQFGKAQLSPKHSPDKKAVQNLIASMDVEREYWARLEHPFYEFILMLSDKSESEQQILLKRWVAETIQPSIRAVFDAIMKSMDSSARTLRSVAISTRYLDEQLDRLKQQMEA